MSATHAVQSTASQDRVLYVAMELSLSTWKLAFTVGAGQKARIRSVPAGTVLCLDEEITLAKKRFSESGPVVCCYEAGRDGFWVHTDTWYRRKSRISLRPHDRLNGGVSECQSGQMRPVEGLRSILAINASIPFSGRVTTSMRIV
jgi:hypothetical protein